MRGETPKVHSGGRQSYQTFHASSAEDVVSLDFPIAFVSVVTVEEARLYHHGYDTRRERAVPGRIGGLLVGPPANRDSGCLSEQIFKIAISHRHILLSFAKSYRCTHPAHGHSVELHQSLWSVLCSALRSFFFAHARPRSKPR